MARTKRRGSAAQQAVYSAPETERCRAAGYVRLSIADSGKPGAETVETQKRLVTQYIENDPSLEFTGLFCDNGHTGTDFDRPEFDRLMEAVRRGEVNCIVVKDLSRFGRNYKETGNYLERVFPFLGIRFIAVDDNFDTLTAERNEYGLIVPLKNMINETYSRDISKKVSSAIESKEKRGEFIGVWAPYGYKKNSDNHHKLEINEETAPVVREIFSMRLQGFGYERIARALNTRGVLSPSAYLFQAGLTKRERYKNTHWNTCNIKSISRDPVYLGHLVQGKRTQQSYKQARAERYAPEAEWRVTPNAHAPVVDEAVFTAVQSMAEERKAAYEASLGVNGSVKTDNLFRGLVYCADCGKALSRRQLRTGSGKFYYSFLCLTALNDPGACSRKNLSERELLEVVSDSVRCHMAAVTELEARIQAAWEKTLAGQKQALARQIATARRELVHTQALYDGLYQNLVDGVLTRGEYLSLKTRYQAQCEEKGAAVNTLQERETQAERCSPENPMFQVLRGFQSGGDLSAELLRSLISRIEYGGRGDLRIQFTYQDEFEALSQMMERTASV